jgi:hypothetical protein
MELVYFVLCSYGITQVLVFSHIFNRIRPPYHFFRCPMCVGFWVGVFLLASSPYTDLFTYTVSGVNGFLLGSLSSGTSYILCMLISDGGLQHEYKGTTNVDTKVDAPPSRQVLQG